MSIKRLVWLFLLALLVGGVVNVPASFVLKQAGIPGANLPNVGIQGVSGTVWSGQAQSVDIQTVKGTHTLSDFKWCVNPLYLFLGKAKARVSFGSFGGNAESDVSVSLGKTLSVDDLTYSGALQPLVQAFSNGMADATANALLKIEHVTYPLEAEQGKLNWPKNLKGQLLLSKGQLLRPMPMLVGDVQVDMTQTDGGQINAVINGKQGELDMSGNASITANLNYATDIKLSPTDKLQSSVESALGLALPKQADGSFAVKRKGTLPLR